MELQKNLAQIRAKNAWEARLMNFDGAKKGRNVVKRIPSMIIENGLLGAMAFAIEKKNKNQSIVGYYNVFCALLKHFKDEAINEESVQTVPDNQVNVWFFKLINTCSSADLRRVTSESLAYLSYLRRFVTDSGDVNE